METVDKYHLPEAKFMVSPNGLTVFSDRLNTPRFIPYDLMRALQKQFRRFFWASREKGCNNRQQ
jgi:hypothetical protein